MRAVGIRGALADWIGLNAMDSFVRLEIDFVKLYAKIGETIALCLIDFLVSR